ncbi:hypothetical protein NEOLEDRAFT_1114189 [Neolentinus lepideus HHB14362 ss-1]|uniref:DUF7729 domain-containing protein n=1 Tax=Neolentinus lepideus HHB14362 ss-1 TaxID=1314782 RepID=A0A165SWL1_9AGAM|nr:hypothetical protein NEOLEDRAFT_1114189 [Neolentinus lepideus HHB14362 ss-1]
MFTPPPSPLPFAQKALESSESLPSNGITLAVPPSYPSSRSPSPPSQVHAHQRTSSLRNHEAKLRSGRRTRWTILLVPAVLIIITASTRYLSHPAAFDILSAHRPSNFDSWTSALTDWKFHEHRTKHRRTPDTVPDPLSTVSASTATAVSSSAVTGPLSATFPSTPTASAISLPTIPADPPVLPTPFPQPFDQLEQNFSTQGCQAFFIDMLQAEDLRDCRAFSLLLQNSFAFSEAQSNITEMNAIIWGTCNTPADEDTCVSTMASYLSQMRSQCSKEISNDFSAVTQAVAGLEAYSLMRTVACETDPSTNTYCFIDAISNTNPSDLFFYYLPLGIAVPTSSTPTCDACTQTLMGLYDQAQKNVSALQQTYNDAALFARSTCGSNYVAAVGGANGATRLAGMGRSYTVMVALLGVAVVMSLL